MSETHPAEGIWGAMPSAEYIDNPREGLDSYLHRWLKREEGKPYEQYFAFFAEREEVMEAADYLNSLETSLAEAQSTIARQRIWAQVGLSGEADKKNGDKLVAINEMVGRLEAELAEAQKERDREIEYTEVLTAIIDGYDWLADGRGEFSYDDGRYDDCVMQFVQQLRDVMHGYRSEPYQSYVNATIGRAEAAEQQLAEAKAELATLQDFKRELERRHAV